MTTDAQQVQTLADLDWPVRTESLELRRARSEDAAEVWPWYRLPEVQEWTTTLNLAPAAHQQWWDERWESTIVGLRAGRIVASGMILRQDPWSQADMVEQARGQQAELGWVLDPGVQGRGLGTEFAAALLDIAVDGLGVRRVEAQCFAENLASRRVMEKIGMRCEGVFVEESLHRSGRWLDAMSWAILAREHRERQH